MISWLTRVCSYFSGVALLAMAFLGVADIVGVHLFASPMPGMVEITSSLMVAAVFLGLPMTEARGQNVRVEILVQRAPRVIMVALALLSRLAIAALFALIAWFGTQSFMRSIATNEYAQGLIEVPYWPARLALVVGAALVVLQAFRAAMREIRAGTLEQDAGTTWKL